MSWFKSFITAFCTAGICFGALYIISPSGKMEKSVKYILSLCFLLIILTVAGIELKSVDFQVDFSNIVSHDTTDLKNETAEYVFKIALRNAGIDFKEISVFTDNSKTDSISCTKVKIITDCNREMVVSALGGEKEDFEVEVINE